MSPPTRDCGHPVYFCLFVVYVVAAGLFEYAEREIRAVLSYLAQ